MGSEPSSNMPKKRAAKNPSAKQHGRKRVKRAGCSTSDGADTSSVEMKRHSSSDSADTSSVEMKRSFSSDGTNTSSVQMKGNSFTSSGSSSNEMSGNSTSDCEDSSSYESDFHDSEAEADIEFEEDSGSMFVADMGAELVEPDASTHSDTIKKNLFMLREFKWEEIPDDVLHGIELDGAVVESKIIELFRGIGASVLKDGVPYFKIPWNKTVFDSTLGYYVKKKAPRSGYATMLSKKSSLYVCLLSRILVLIQDERMALAKEVTLWDQTFYETTENVKAALDAICMSFGCVRSSLRIISGSKGRVVGLLSYRVKHTWVNCDSPQPIPSEDAIPKDFKSEADFILVVEKDTIFQSLATSDFCGRYGGIMVTAEGHRNVNTRMFVQTLRRKLRIPVFVLVDCNPSGFIIMSAYKHGAETRAFENHRMAVPDLKWIGLHPTDVEKYNISNHGVGLTTRDIENLESLLKKPCVNDVPGFKTQLEHMKSTNTKYQIESLGTSLTRYLLDKLEFKDWI